MSDQTSLFDPSEARAVPHDPERLQVLVYPNITYQRNLDADSYIVVVRSMIKHLLATRDDLHFVMLLPDHVDSLDMPGVEQVIYPLPTYPNTMRAHFDTRDFLKAIDWQNRSYDIVWSHLPEHTLAIRNVFDNATNERPVFIGYCHWFEVKENTAYSTTMFPVNVAGLTAMEECGVNSLWLKALICGRVDATMGSVIAKQVCDILRPQYLGCDPVPALAIAPEPNRIIFNHRPNDYTGFREAVTAFDTLWERRQDFRVAFTLVDVDRPWAERVNAVSRQAYLEQLARSWIGIGRFKQYSAWSMSVMDGLSVGVPYVLPNTLCYPEMIGSDYPLIYDKPRDFLPTVERSFDVALRMKASAAATAIADSFTWGHRITDYSAMFDRAIAKLPTLSKPSEHYERVKALAQGGATKKQIIQAMGWGVRVGWSPYRHRLRADGIGVKS